MICSAGRSVAETRQSEMLQGVRTSIQGVHMHFHTGQHSHALSCSTRHDPCIAKVDIIPKSRCPDLSVGYRNERREMRRVTPTRPEEKPPPSLAYDTRYHPLAVQIIFRKTWGNFDPEPSNRIHRGRNLGPVWSDRILRSYRTKSRSQFRVFFF